MSERSPFARPEPDSGSATPEPSRIDPASRPRRAYADPDPVDPVPVDHVPGEQAPRVERPPVPTQQAPAAEDPLWQPDTAQPVRRGRPGLWLVAGLLGLALLVGGAFGVRALLAPAAPKAAGPAEQATAYLQALAAGDAERALALSFTKGAGPLLSNDHLKQNRPQISDITVLDAGSGDPAGTEVVLGYRLAGKEVRGSFPMFQNPQRQWLLRRGSVQLRIAPAPKMIPVQLDGQKLESTGYTYLVDVFPGTHRLSTGSNWLDFKNPEFTVTSLTDPPSVDAATAVTAAYQSAAKQRVSERIKSCAASTELAPPGCPWARKAHPDQPVKTGSVKYQVLSERITVGQPGSVDAIAHGEAKLRVRMTSSVRVDGSYQQETEEFDADSRFAMDLLSAGPDFVWE